MLLIYELIGFPYEPLKIKIKGIIFILKRKKTASIKIKKPPKIELKWLLFIE
jgi:hypothetical protein